jgi:hypothetical protein
MVTSTHKGKTIYHDGSIWRYIGTDKPIMEVY